MCEIPDSLRKLMREAIDEKMRAGFGAYTTANTAGSGPEWTASKLKETLRELKSVAPPRRFDPLALPVMPIRGLGDIEIYDAPPPAQKVRCRQIYFKDGTPILPEKFLAETNAELAARFGYHEDIFKDRAYLFGNRIVMSAPMKHQLMSTFLRGA